MEIWSDIIKYVVGGFCTALAIYGLRYMRDRLKFRIEEKVMDAKINNTADEQRRLDQMYIIDQYRQLIEDSKKQAKTAMAKVESDIGHLTENYQKTLEKYDALRMQHAKLEARLTTASRENRDLKDRLKELEK